MPATFNQLSAPVQVPSLGARVARCATGLVLAGLLFGATMWNTELYDLLDAGWRYTTAALGLASSALKAQQAGSGVGQLMHHTHSVPAVLAFGLLYIAISLALQCVLLSQPAQRRLACQFYGGACGVALGLLLASQVGGGEAFTALNKQLVHFVVSPLPVIILVPLLRWYLPTYMPEATPPESGYQVADSMPK